MLCNGENHIKMGAAESKAVAIGYMRLKIGPSQDVEAIRRTRTPIRKQNKFCMTTASSFERRILFKNLEIMYDNNE